MDRSERNRLTTGRRVSWGVNGKEVKKVCHSVALELSPDRPAAAGARVGS